MLLVLQKKLSVDDDLPVFCQFCNQHILVLVEYIFVSNPKFINCNICNF